MQVRRDENRASLGAKEEPSSSTGASSGKFTIDTFVPATDAQDHVGYRRGVRLFFVPTRRALPHQVHEKKVFPHSEDIREPCLLLNPLHEAGDSN